MSRPTVVCLDLEGVLVPEIWINVAEKTKIKELRLTTRDEPDYDKLMKRRIEILKGRGITLKDVQDVIAKMQPLPGAKKFLDALRREHQTIILSDTFYEFAKPLMEKLNYPAIFCNWLHADSKNFISGYTLRRHNGKEHAVRELKKIGFRIHAAGDSYNDITMLKAADKGSLFNPPPNIVKEFPKFKVAKNYQELFKALHA